MVDFFMALLSSRWIQHPEPDRPSKPTRPGRPYGDPCRRSRSTARDAATQSPKASPERSGDRGSISPEVSRTRGGAIVLVPADRDIDWAGRPARRAYCPWSRRFPITTLQARGQARSSRIQGDGLSERSDILSGRVRSAVRHLREMIVSSVACERADINLPRRRSSVRGRIEGRRSP